MSRITGSEVKNLMEAYADVYEQQEVIDEQDTVFGRKGKDWYQVQTDASGKKTQTKLDPSKINPEAKARYERLKSQDWRSKVGQRDPATLSREAEAARKAQLASASGKREPGSRPPAPAPSPAAAPKPAAPVLSKQGGVEGTGVGKDFKAKAWSDTERQRYTSTAKVAPSKPSGASSMTPMRQWAAANPKLAAKVVSPPAAERVGTQMGTGQSVMSKQAAELRAMRAASQLRQQGANVTGDMIKNVSIEKPKPIKASYEYDAYDLVLEYLLDNGHADTIDEAHYIMLEMDVEMVGDIVEETLQEKLKSGTTRVSFSTGKDAKFNQAMTEKNPRTGRQRATSPELKAMGAHGRAKSAQYDAENRGDTEAARRHETRRGKIAHTVYRKTGRIIDRADND